MESKDRKVGEVLKQQQANIDASAVWSNIADALPRKEEKRIGFWWLLVLLIPIFAGSVYYVMVTEKKANEHIQDVELAEIDTQEIRGIKGVDSTSEKLKDATILNNEAAVYEDKLANNKRKIVVPQDNEAAYSFAATKGNNQHASQTAAIEKVVPKSPPSTSAKVLDQPKNERSNTRDNYREVVSNISELPIAINGVERSDERIKEFDKNLLTSVNPIKRHHRDRFAFVVSAGANKSFPVVSGIKNHEVGLYGVSLSGGLEYHTNRRWTWMLGLAYDNNVTRYEDRSTEIISTSVSGVAEVMIDAQGLESAITGEIQQVNQITNDIRWHRRHQGVDIHLAAQKNFLLSNRLRAGISAGMAYNLATSSQGYGYDTQETFKIVKFETDPGFYHRRTGFKPLLGVEFSYRLRNIELLFNVNYKWNLDPINTQINYQIKHSQTGIQLGTRYYLNGN